MSRIRGKNTTPEMVVRSLLHKLGYRFRLHVRIPVTTPTRRFPLRLDRGEGQGEVSKETRTRRFIIPDIVLPRYRVAVFVHGCFWHRHRGCKNCTTPTHRRAWWVKKLEGNAARDRLHQRALRQLGWRPFVIWECQTEKPKQMILLSRKLSKLIT